MSKVKVPRLTRDLNNHLTVVWVVEDNDRGVPVKVLEAHIAKVRKYDRIRDGKGFYPFDALQVYADTLFVLEDYAQQKINDPSIENFEAYLMESLFGIFQNYFRLVVGPATRKLENEQELGNTLKYLVSHPDWVAINSVRECLHVSSRGDQRILNAYMDSEEQSERATPSKWGAADILHIPYETYRRKWLSASKHFMKTYEARYHVRGKSAAEATNNKAKED